MKLTLRSWVKNQDGAAAVEFAIVSVPFLLLLVGILDIALMFFVNGVLNAAVENTVREVRVGGAYASGWSADAFKAKVCAQIPLNIDCRSSLIVTATPMDDFSSVKFPRVIQNGKLDVSDSFSSGASGGYMMVQVFLPWSSLLGRLGAPAARLSDGRLVLVATVIFRNEPFDV